MRRVPEDLCLRLILLLLGFFRNKSDSCVGVAWGSSPCAHACVKGLLLLLRVSTGTTRHPSGNRQISRRRALL